MSTVGTALRIVAFAILIVPIMVHMEGPAQWGAAAALFLALAGVGAYVDRWVARKKGHQTEPREAP